MTRRIDELGRLVIPKEIRKNLKIKNNDQVEINVIDNKIVLNKYDCINKDRVISIILKTLRKSINMNILFTSRDKIIDYALINKEIINNNELNEDMMNIIENRKDIVEYVYNDLLYYINPLVINGDLYGSLIVYGNSRINDKHMEIIKYTQKIFENYLE